MNRTATVAASVAALLALVVVALGVVAGISALANRDIPTGASAREYVAGHEQGACDVVSGPTTAVAVCDGNNGYWSAVIVRDADGTVLKAEDTRSAGLDDAIAAAQDWAVENL